MKTFASLLWQTWNAWTMDRASRLGAALAYYALFSLIPLCVIAIGIAGTFVGEGAAQQQLLDRLSMVLGLPAVETVNALLRQTREQTISHATTGFGIAVLVFGATQFFVHLKSALDTIWEVPLRHRSRLGGFLHKYGLSILSVLAASALLLSSLVLTSIAQMFGAYATAADLLISFGMIPILFAMIFRYLPDAKVSWRCVWPAAFLTSVLLLCGKYMLAWVLGHTAIGSIYGVASSVVVFLVWLYFSAQVFLLGAEFSFVYERYLRRYT